MNSWWWMSYGSVKKMWVFKWGRQNLHALIKLNILDYVFNKLFFFFFGKIYNIDRMMCEVLYKLSRYQMGICKQRDVAWGSFTSTNWDPQLRTQAIVSFHVIARSMKQFCLEQLWVSYLSLFHFKLYRQQTFKRGFLSKRWFYITCCKTQFKITWVNLFSLTSAL